MPYVLRARPPLAAQRTAAGSHRIWMLIALIASASLLGPSSSWSVDGAATRLTYEATGREASDVLAALSELSGVNHELDVGLLVARLGSAKLDLYLANASPATQRQALGHALATWWAVKADRSVMFLRSAQVPQGSLSVSSYTSALRNQPGCENLVRELLKPWLGGDAGILLVPSEGTWSATLDAAGREHLLEAIDLIERGSPRCASVIADPDQPDLERRLSGALRIAGWSELASTLGRAAGCSVSLGPHLRSAPFPVHGLSLAPITLHELPTALKVFGIEARFQHGVLCLETTRAGLEEREHPAQRRRLALFPIPQLANNRIAGEFIATGIKRAVTPAWWTQPGAGLVYLESAQSLLVAADPRTQMAVLDALAYIEREGIDEGLKTLATTGSFGD